MLVKSFLVLLTLAAMSQLAVAEETPTPEGLEYCTVCHGSQLKGNANIGAPRLSGLPQWYIERQLLNFKQGIRGAHSDDDRGMEMRPMVSGLSVDELKAIAAWVAKTESDKPKATLTADSSAGKALYQSCAACHGAQGEGNKAIGAPSLTGLNDWYLVTQLNHFRLNVRGAQSADTYGQQMKAASVMVTSEQDAANLAAYITQLN
ncbi:MAG: c-type cytochrome [Paraglaciecola sp.]|uniref:c-type cytochrome n=1 Tax=Paraglaciecola sp. TaxID=1920173 RepID=UPI00273FE2BC|nr:cytochrome c [Paraglaciecola sp.]MDP5030812.1 c-type cytochrome [Paraglaciecola sp.]MDP5129563.1 c-type cytochrome [Paraglaciecola sp.]